MRLIDADELKMYLIQANEWQEIITTDDVLEIIERQTVVDTSKNLLCTIRVNMDTEEVLGLLKERGWGPVEQGRWERHYSRPNVFADSYWHCSECGYKTANQWANRYYKYCPNCGVKMDDKRIKYRKKPIVIEAYQTKKEMDIETLEGIMHASVGDYIITGVNGEQYPCKPDIFEKTYEPVMEVEE